MRRRLVILSVAITAMVVIAFVIPLGLLVRDLAADRAIGPAQLRAQALAPVVGLADVDTVRAAVEATQQAVGGDVHVVTPTGLELGDGPFPNVPVDVAGVFALPDGGRVAVVPVLGADAEGVVAISVSAADLRRGVLAAWGLLCLLGILVVAVAAWLTDRLARSTTTALTEVEQTARQLSMGDLDARSTVVDPLEVERIGVALNELADRTQELLAEERERAADLSHALRTPLTALRLDLEALTAATGRDRVIDDLAALEAAVDQAIHEARRPVREGGGRRCDLAEVVRERVAWWDVLAQDEGRSLGAEVVGGECWVRGAAQDFTQALDALIGNVFSHTEPPVGLRVALVRDSGQVVLRVVDEGPGFPAGLDVLARGVSGGGSTGLGLAIVQATAVAAGGTVELDGSTVEVVMPEVAGPR